MSNAAKTLFREGVYGIRVGFGLFLDASLSEKIIVLGVSFLIAFVFRIFHGTFVIDHASLILPPYLIAYWLYNRRGVNRRLAEAGFSSPLARSLKSPVYRFELMTFPLTLLFMWIGGIMPYFNWIDPVSVYFGIFPVEWLGGTGNYFMWNGFLTAFGIEVVAPELLPTGLNPFFFGYASLYWLSFIPVFMFGVSEGRALAFLKLHPFHPYLWKHRAKMIMFAALAILADIALIRLVVWLSTNFG